jgi:hypothetical protein
MNKGYTYIFLVFTINNGDYYIVYVLTKYKEDN